MELLDLPDELILAIINKIQPAVLAFTSIIGIGNNRLERLALDRCHSIVLSFYHPDFPYKKLLLDVMPRNFHRIQSITTHFMYIPYLDAISKQIDYESLSKLTHLKIVTDRIHHNTGTPYTMGYYYDNPLRHNPLFSLIPQFFYHPDSITDKVLSYLQKSLFMDSIVHFEYDDHCALPIPPIEKESLFPRSSHLTHLRITLPQFGDCLRLLKQLESQLCSLYVTLVRVRTTDPAHVLSEIKSISCSKLKHLTMNIYRNILHYNQCILPLLQHLTKIEHLVLLFAIGMKNRAPPDHFIDGYDLEQDIISYMPNLHQFDFHIRSIVRNAPYVDINHIRQSFNKIKQPFDCAIDYFNNDYGQCQIYSIPFISNRLDFISHCFPLFDNEKNLFSNVTMLLLFDDRKAFEHSFFERLVQTLPHLKTLEIYNEIEQEERNQITKSMIVFRHVTVLILHNIHVDYGEQLLCESFLPSLIELVIRDNVLTSIIDKNNQQSRNNCSNVETLRIVEPWIEPTDVHLELFPCLYKRMYDKN